MSRRRKMRTVRQATIMAPQSMPAAAAVRVSQTSGNRHSDVATAEPSEVTKMNTPIETTRATETSLTRDWINLARYYVARYLGGRRGLIVLTLAAVVVGLALNWSWLVAVGVAPLLISLAPCAVMCALGLCMSRMGGQSCSTQSSSTNKETEVRSSPSVLDADTAREPSVVPSNRTADAPPVKPGEVDDERAVALARREARRERS